MMTALQLQVCASMLILDGGPDAALPVGSGGPILAGTEAIFIAGRVESDASTKVRIGIPGEEGQLLHAYTGQLLTPLRQLRVVSVEGESFGEVTVPDPVTSVSIYLTDFEEPDEIFVAVNVRGS